MWKLVTVLIATVILAGSLHAFRADTAHTGGASRDSSDPGAVLVALYAGVPPGGSISVAAPSLTDPRIAIELVQAKQRGVNVRVIADRQRLAEKRNEISLYNLQHYGVPVKVNIRKEPMTLKTSIINGAYVATGTYDYSSSGVPDHSLTVTGGRGNDLLQRYEKAFDSMWADKESVKVLEPMDAVRVVALTGLHFHR
jgi:hypothetical protein